MMHQQHDNNAQKFILDEIENLQAEIEDLSQLQINAKIQHDINSRLQQIAELREALKAIMPHDDSNELDNVRHRLHRLEERVTELAVSVGILEAGSGGKHLTNSGWGFAFAIVFAAIITIVTIVVGGN